jgi:ferrous iron transport protein A
MFVKNRAGGSPPAYGGMDMPLSMLEKGVDGTVKNIRGKDETKRFLTSLGFNIGGSVVIVSEISGDLIVKVKDARVAISKSLANQIIV